MTSLSLKLALEHLPQLQSIRQLQGPRLTIQNHLFCPALTNLVDNSGAEDPSVDSTVYGWRSSNGADLIIRSQSAFGTSNGRKPRSGTMYL